MNPHGRLAAEDLADGADSLSAGALPPLLFCIGESHHHLIDLRLVRGDLFRSEHEFGGLVRSDHRFDMLRPRVWAEP